MSEKRSLGRVYFNDLDFFHLASFSNEEDKTCAYDERTRWAYLVLNKEETTKLVGNESDNEKILNKVKNKYKKYLLDAVKRESKDLTSFQLKSNELKIDNKYVKLISASLHGSKSLGSILKTKQYFCPYEHDLSSEEKSKKETQISSTISFTAQKVQDILDREKDEFRKTSKENNKANILISMPYVYNYKENSEIKELELISYEDKINISFMPKLQVEYGVFFDGTNNNMYNVDFYRTITKIVSSKTIYIQDNVNMIAEPKENIENYRSIEEYIISEDNPSQNSHIMNMLRDEIITSVRYFEEDSKDDEKADYDSYFSRDNASKDSEYIFEFLLQVKNTLKNNLNKGFFDKVIASIPNPITRGALQDLNKEKKIDGTPKEIRDFIVADILPSEGSYTNGYTNIKRLYDSYKGNDKLNKSETAHREYRKYFKVYASGSGTIDPIDEEELESDEFFGLGLGFGKTGILEHIIYTCEKMITQLRVESINSIDELVLDTFGFSRGATEARHFICSILENYEKKKHQNRGYNLDTTDQSKSENIFSPFYKYDGVYAVIDNEVHFNPLCTHIEEVEVPLLHTMSLTKAVIKSIFSDEKKVIVKNEYYKKDFTIESLSFRFTGIYDTVTHYGLLQSNDASDLKLHFDEKKVGKVVHIMAENEYRFNFEAHSALENRSEKKDNILEFSLPGAHADVGGGYVDNKDDSVILSMKLQNAAVIKNLNKLYSIHPSYKPIGKYLAEMKKETNRAFENRLIAWNKKYAWCKKSVPKTIPIVKDFTSLKNEEIKDGFYKSKNSTFYYMHRTNISNKYEYVPLTIMYDKSIEDKNKEEHPPFKDIKKEFAIKDEFLKNNIYKSLYQEQKISQDDLFTLRQNYMHHSSSWFSLTNISAIANIPSILGNKSVKNEIFGKRIIYGSKGGEFK